GGLSQVRELTQSLLQLADVVTHRGSPESPCSGWPLCDHCSMFRRSTSIKLFDVFGFRVGADASWFLILFLMIYLLSSPFRATLHSSDGVAYVTTVISVLLLFASLIA